MIVLAFTAAKHNLRKNNPRFLRSQAQFDQNAPRFLRSQAQFDQNAPRFLRSQTQFEKNNPRLYRSHGNWSPVFTVAMGIGAKKRARPKSDSLIRAAITYPRRQFPTNYFRRKEA